MEQVVTLVQENRKKSCCLHVVNPIVSAKPLILRFQAQQNQTIFGTKVIICRVSTFITFPVAILLGSAHFNLGSLPHQLEIRNSNLKYGFHNKSFILNAPLVSCPIPVIRFGWVCCCTHPKRMTGIGQLTRGAFRINDLL